MWDFCRLIWWALVGLFRSGRALEAENLVLRRELRAPVCICCCGPRRAAATFCDVYRQSINERMLAIERVTTPILGYVCRAIAGRVRSPIAEPDGMWHALRR